MFGLLLFIIKSSLVLTVGLILTQNNSYSAAIRHLILMVAMMSTPLIWGLEKFVPPWFSIALPDFIQTWIFELNFGLIHYAEGGAPPAAVIILDRLKNWLPLVLPAYVFCVLVMVLYWFTRIMMTSKWVWETHLLRGEPIFMRETGGRQVSLRQSCIYESPYTWGIFRPVIVVPIDWLGWTEEKRASVVAHELAHIRRYDALTTLLSGFLCCLLWYNPLVWLVHRRLLLVAEQACDDQVISKHISPVDYASHLLEIARAKHFDIAPAMSNSSRLSNRINALLDKGRIREALNPGQLATVIAISFILIIPIGLTKAAAIPDTVMPAHPLLNERVEDATSNNAGLIRRIDI